MKYRYSQEARERIAAIGQTAISDFIDTIPAGLLDAAYSTVPPTPGFRPKTPGEFKAKQKRLVGQLSHANQGKAGGSEWDFFASLWAGNWRHRLGEVFPSAGHAAPDIEAGAAFVEELAARCTDLSREDAERIYQFGPFPDLEDNASLFARFKPAAELERARVLELIPVKVEAIGAELRGLKTDLRETVGRIEQITVCLNEAGAEARAAGSKAESADAAVKTLRSEFSLALVELEERERLLQTQASDRLAEKIAGLEEDLATLAITETAWARFTSDMADLSQRLAELGEAVDELSRRQSDPQGLVEALERIRSVEGLLTAGPGPTRTPGVRLLETACDGDPRQISEVADAVEMVSSNMWAAGLARGDADRYAREVVAALVSGQVVQFAGSLADFLADACAAAIGGPAFHEWHVPVGLTSDEAAAECLGAAVDKGSACLLLKGANLSAFEVYGTSVRELVVRRQFGVDLGGPALMATWSQGPAAFPEGGTLAELGPVMDTDLMRWRPTAPMKKLSFGILGFTDWSALEGIERDPDFSGEELAELLGKHPFAHGRLWLRISARAYRALRGIPGRSEAGDLRSVMESWTLPWARVVDGPVEDIAVLIAKDLAETDAHSGVLAEA
ncbi:hypothetical protein GALL_174320 [mine drainage metagenome]|uniref:Uncharacterized protein n=1 Tax=mine drainage metagenome TaxID=410659 RepID=A0A1J5RXA5_9ZZZZ